MSIPIGSCVYVLVGVDYFEKLFFQLQLDNVFFLPYQMMIDTFTLKRIYRYSRIHKKPSNLKNTTLGEEPVSIIYYTSLGSIIKQPTQN